LYVNDINSGPNIQPLKSLSEAARGVNLNKEEGETTIGGRFYRFRIKCRAF